MRQEHKEDVEQEEEETDHDEPEGEPKVHGGRPEIIWGTHVFFIKDVSRQL